MCITPFHGNAANWTGSAASHLGQPSFSRSVGTSSEIAIKIPSGVNGPVVVNLLDPTLRKFPSEHVVRAGELGVGEGDLGALTLGSEVLQRVEIQHPLECVVRLQSGRRGGSGYLSGRSRGERG